MKPESWADIKRKIARTAEILEGLADEDRVRLTPFLSPVVPIIRGGTFSSTPVFDGSSFARASTAAAPGVGVILSRMQLDIPGIYDIWLNISTDDPAAQVADIALRDSSANARWRTHLGVTAGDAQQYSFAVESVEEDDEIFVSAGLAWNVGTSVFTGITGIPRGVGHCS